MIIGHNIADIVVILKTLPTKECIGALGNRILDDLKNPGIIFYIPILIPS